MKEPQTLKDAIEYFSDDDVCFQYVVNLRWSNGAVTCPHCKSRYVSFVSTRKIWNCLNCKKQFSVRVGTIFEDSAVSLDKWLVAMWMIANAKNGVSSCEIARTIGVTQKTAWFMAHRIRLAMQTESTEPLDGEIEADDTFVGGKASNMHKSKRERKVRGRGGVGKAIVAGILERGGEVRTKMIPDTSKETLLPLVANNVEQGATVYTDANPSSADTSKRRIMPNLITTSKSFLEWAQSLPHVVIPAGLESDMQEAIAEAEAAEQMRGADGYDFTAPNDNPYILSGEELARAEAAARSR